MISLLAGRVRLGCARPSKGHCVTADESESAREDLWLTYQNYDPAVKQAVRRLGALPGNNVEEFRSLLLASRERSRAKEFEADVVRRLQGEAFVGDEVLQ